MKQDPLDRKIMVVEDKIIRVRKWLGHVEKAIKRKAKRKGWTKALTKQMKQVNRRLEDIQECQNDLNMLKSDRNIQKRIMRIILKTNKYRKRK